MCAYWNTLALNGTGELELKQCTLAGQAGLWRISSAAEPFVWFLDCCTTDCITPYGTLGGELGGGGDLCVVPELLHHGLHNAV